MSQIVIMNRFISITNASASADDSSCTKPAIFLFARFLPDVARFLPERPKSICQIFARFLPDFCPTFARFLPMQVLGSRVREETQFLPDSGRKKIMPWQIGWRQAAEEPGHDFLSSGQPSRSQGMISFLPRWPPRSQGMISFLPPAAWPGAFP